MTEQGAPMPAGEILLYQTEDGKTELERTGTIKESLTVPQEGNRRVSRSVEHYNLKQRGRWAFAKFTEVYQIEAEFVKKVKAEFNKMIERVAHES